MKRQEKPSRQVLGKIMFNQKNYPILKASRIFLLFVVNVDIAYLSQACSIFVRECFHLNPFRTDLKKD